MSYGGVKIHTYGGHVVRWCGSVVQRPGSGGKTITELRFPTQFNNGVQTKHLFGRGEFQPTRLSNLIADIEAVSGVRFAKRKGGNIIVRLEESEELTHRTAQPVGAQIMAELNKNSVNPRRRWCGDKSGSSGGRFSYWSR